MYRMTLFDNLLKLLRITIWILCQLCQSGKRCSPRVRVLWADDATTHHFANLFRQLRAQGTPIPTNDLWIAALCVQQELTLASRDAHFDSLPQIPRW
jgi:predicted nucleic acid-binding protein